MFSRIAGRYDLMNTIMTAGLDRRWRRQAAAQAALHPGDLALDVCCGTGDLAFALAASSPGACVIGLDFSQSMLDRAAEKAVRFDTRHAGDGATTPTFVMGDVVALPFADGHFSAVTVAFGVRNVPDLPRALAEMARVTRAGGRVVCLEITTPPPGLGRRFHRVWFDRVVPLLGGMVAGDPSAYSYLPESVRSFPEPDALAVLMARAGLVDVRYRRFGLGIVALHVGTAPGREAAHG